MNQPEKQTTQGMEPRKVSLMGGELPWPEDNKPNLCILAIGVPGSGKSVGVAVEAYRKALQDDTVCVIHDKLSNYKEVYGSPVLDGDNLSEIDSSSKFIRFSDFSRAVKAAQRIGRAIVGTGRYCLLILDEIRSLSRDEMSALGVLCTTRRHDGVAILGATQTWKNTSKDFARLATHLWVFKVTSPDTIRAISNDVGRDIIDPYRHQIPMLEPGEYFEFKL